MAKLGGLGIAPAAYSQVSNLPVQQDPTLKHTSHTQPGSDLIPSDVFLQVETIELHVSIFLDQIP